MTKQRTAPPDEKIVYSYSRETREYIGEYKCQKDPLNEGAFLIPADATETPPPETTELQKAVFENGAWIKKTDYRGHKVVFLDSQQICEIREIGELPDGAALISESDEQELYAGKRARLDEDGNLEFFTPPPTTEERIATMEHELADTDWYVVRWAETGKETPPEITARRAELREQINNLRNEGAHNG